MRFLINIISPYFFCLGCESKFHAHIKLIVWSTILLKKLAVAQLVKESIQVPDPVERFVMW
jgi:hypothetical protein